MTQIETANRIVRALDGYHTEAGSYGHRLLSARVWAKGTKCRVYLDSRHVGTNGSVNRNVDRVGYIEILSSGELVIATRNNSAEIGRVAKEA